MKRIQYTPPIVVVYEENDLEIFEVAAGNANSYGGNYNNTTVNNYNCIVMSNNSVNPNSSGGGGSGPLPPLCGALVGIAIVATGGSALYDAIKN